MFLTEMSYLFLVVNAAQPGQRTSLGSIRIKALSKSVSATNPTSSRNRLPWQRPLSREVLGRLTDYPLDELAPDGFDHVRIAGKEFMVSRSGYTGEDGFEIYGSKRGHPCALRERRGAGSIPLRFGLPGSHSHFKQRCPSMGMRSPEINPLAVGLLAFYSI